MWHYLTEESRSAVVS